MGELVKPTHFWASVSSPNISLPNATALLVSFPLHHRTTAAAFALPAKPNGTSSASIHVVFHLLSISRCKLQRLLPLSWASNDEAFFSIYQGLGLKNLIVWAAKLIEAHGNPMGGNSSWQLEADTKTRKTAPKCSNKGLAEKLLLQVVVTYIQPRRLTTLHWILYVTAWLPSMFQQPGM